MVPLLRFWFIYTVGLLFISVSSASAQAPPAWVGAGMVGATVIPPALAIDGAGNSYQAGRFTGTTVIGGTTLVSQGYDDGFLAKFTPTGALAWVYRIGSAGTDGASGVALDAAGNVYVVGPFGGLFVAVALLSVVALALVNLRERSRQQPDAPADTVGLAASCLRVLRSQRPRPIRTVRDVFYTLAGPGRRWTTGLADALARVGEPALFSRRRTSGCSAAPGGALKKRRPTGQRFFSFG